MMVGGVFWSTDKIYWHQQRQGNLRFFLSFTVFSFFSSLSLPSLLSPSLPFPSLFPSFLPFSYWGWWIEPRASYMLGKQSITKLHPQLNCTSNELYIGINFGCSLKESYSEVCFNLFIHWTVFIEDLLFAKYYSRWWGNDSDENKWNTAFPWCIEGKTVDLINNK